METISNLSDDQMALIMCVGAILCCGLIMSLSHYIGSTNESDEAPQLRVPEPKDSDQSKRKAA